MHLRYDPTSLIRGLGFSFAATLLFSVLLTPNLLAQPTRVLDTPTLTPPPTAGVSYVNGYDTGNPALPVFIPISPPTGEDISHGYSTPDNYLPLYKHAGSSIRSVVELRDDEAPTGMLPLADPATPAAPQAPTVTFTSFDLPTSGFIPADPHGTVGSNHVLVTGNVHLQGFDKSGNPSADLPLQTLQTFFSAPTPTFDPKMVYDPFTDRYLLVTLELVQSGFNPNAGNQSRILVAASPVGTPAGVWNGVAINSKVLSSGTEFWCDYPGFAVDEEAIYVTCNFFPFAGGAPPFLGALLITVDKATLYNGTFNPATDLFLYDPDGGAGLGTGFNFTLQPANVHTNPGGTIGTWLAAYWGLSNGTTEALSIIRMDNPLNTGTGAAFTNTFVDFGNVEVNSFDVLPDAPQNQPGSAAADLEVNDNRTLDAEWRDNSLFVTATTDPDGPAGSTADAGQSTATFWEVDTSSGTPTLVSTNFAGGEDLGTGTTTFFPSIAMNNTDAIIGFSASNSSIFAGAYYARYDRTGSTLGPTETLMAGSASYERLDGIGRNRWGDYSATALDFTDDSFWLVNKVTEPSIVRAAAKQQAPQVTQGSWVVVGGGTVSTLPIELAALTADAEGRDVLLRWTTNSESNNAGFDLEHRYGDGPFEALDFVTGHGTTTEPREYSYRLTALDPGKHSFRLRQVDFDGTATYSPVAEVEVGLSAGDRMVELYPNPVYDRAQLKLALGQAEPVRLDVFDALGRRVHSERLGEVEANQVRRVELAAQDWPAGLYVLQLRGSSFSETRTLMVAH